MEIPNELIAAKKSAVAMFLTAQRDIAEFSAFAVSTVPRQNVVGVGIGRKITDGKSKSSHVIRLYVEKKVGREAIPDNYLLPSEIEGIQTDVIEAGRFRALSVRKVKAKASREIKPRANAAVVTASVPIYQRRLRPARPGGSVGFQFTGAKAGFVMAGTFGALVEDHDGKLYILSNNHVLANENGLPIGSSIFQPGLLDNGNPATDSIATLSRFVQLETAQSNSVDAALAALNDPSLARATLLPKVNRLKNASAVDAAENMKVHKVGRTTGYTTGEVFDISADVTVKYDLGVLSFHDQILIRGDAGAFSGPGDSGSLIVAIQTAQPTGLLFAGSDQFTIANHLSDVLGQLNVSVVR